MVEGSLWGSRVLGGTLGRVLIKDVEFLALTNSLYFVLSWWRVNSPSHEPVSVFGSEVVDSVLAIGHLAERKAAHGHIVIATLLVFLYLHRVVGDQVAVGARQSWHHAPSWCNRDLLTMPLLKHDTWSGACPVVNVISVSVVPPKNAGVHQSSRTVLEHFVHTWLVIHLAMRVCVAADRLVLTWHVDCHVAHDFAVFFVEVGLTWAMSPRERPVSRFTCLSRVESKRASMLVYEIGRSPRGTLVGAICCQLIDPLNCVCLAVQKAEGIVDLVGLSGITFGEVVFFACLMWAQMGFGLLRQLNTTRVASVILLRL